MENLFEMNMTVQQVNAISNLGLAHIGDGVYELLCRSYLCARGEKTLEQLSDLTEAYLSTQLERGFSALDFYKSLLI